MTQVHGFGIRNDFLSHLVTIDYFAYSFLFISHLFFDKYLIPSSILHHMFSLRPFFWDSDGISSFSTLESEIVFWKLFMQGRRVILPSGNDNRKKLSIPDEGGRAVRAHATARQQGGRVSFGSSERRRVVFVIKKSVEVHLSPLSSPTWEMQSVQYNLCAIPAVVSRHRSVCRELKVILDCHFAVVKKVAWGAPLLLPLSYWQPLSDLFLLTEHIQADFSLYSHCAKCTCANTMLNSELRLVNNKVG